MKPSNEEKARFFAQYWKQRVLCSVLHGGIVKVESYFLHKDNLQNGDHLILKPLSSISDEDAIEVARMSVDTERNITGIKRTENSVSVKMTDTINVHQRYNVKLWMSGNIEVRAKSGENWVYNHNWNQISIFDYLRSKGYALPFNGHTVEEMIEWGWLKLKEK